MAVIWIFVPAFATTMGSLMTDIINGMCVPWGAYSGYVAAKAMPSTMVSFVYLVPLTLTIFCYSKIVYKIRNKVTSFCTM